MNVVGIFGSGFGLYGYLPSIAKTYKIILPYKAKAIIKNRCDIAHLLDFVIFGDETYILENVDSLIIATTPSKQENLLGKISQHSNIKNIFLEKPVATNANRAIHLQHTLFNRMDVNIRIAYLFIHCPWFEILEQVAKSSQIAIEWKFLAHHYKNNMDIWKRDDRNGGGAINFFGIHLIAICSYLGYSDVLSVESKQTNPHQTYYFQAICIKNKRPFRILLDSNAQSESFCIMQDNNIIYQANNPFECPLNADSKNVDTRIIFLEKYIQSIKNCNEKYYKWYKETAILWQKILKSS